MAYVYRYRDINDGIIKYVGIVWSDNRTLSQRVKEHEKDDWYSKGNWWIEYANVDIKSRTDAEYIESHLIAHYGTDKWFNKSKSGWGESSFVGKIDKWKPFYTISREVDSTEINPIKYFEKPASDYYSLDLIIRGTYKTTMEYSRKDGTVIRRPIVKQSEEIIKDYKKYLTMRANIEEVSVAEYIHWLIEKDMNEHIKK